MSTCEAVFHPKRDSIKIQILILCYELILKVNIYVNKIVQNEYYISIVLVYIFCLIRWFIMLLFHISGKDRITWRILCCLAVYYRYMKFRVLFFSELCKTWLHQFVVCMCVETGRMDEEESSRLNNWIDCIPTLGNIKLKWET